MYGFTKPTPEDMAYLAAHMRREERVEVNRSSYLRSLPEIVERAIRRSFEAWSIKRDGVLLGITGVHAPNPLTGHACAWLMTTEDMKQYPVFFIRQTRKMLSRWHTRWPLLYNFVDAEYTDSLRWAEAAGFDIKPAVPMGMGSRPFHPIHHRRPQDV